LQDSAEDKTGRADLWKAKWRIRRPLGGAVGAS